MAQMVRNDQEYERQIEAAYRDLHNLLSQNKQLAPTLLRLAFHDAGTYDAKTNTGGPNGSVRNELNTPPNVKMDIAINFCEPVKQRHPMITYADLYQLAGVVAVEVTGGPKIRFVPGRKDAPPQQDQGSLPNPSPSGSVVGHLRTIFQRMGLSDKDIVVLSGAHTLGRAHQDRSGFDGPFTRDPLTFDNSYYVELMKGDSQGLVKFPTDKALMQDPVFRRYVQVYAQDERKFFKHYAKSHKKMSELGFHPNQTSTHTTTAANNTNVLGVNFALGNPVDLLNALDERKFFKHYAKSHKKMSELGFHPNQHGSRQHQPPQSHPNPHHNRHNDHAAPHQQSQCRPHRACPFA